MRIAVLYNTSEEAIKGKDSDRLADNEVLETANAVKLALERRGHKATLQKVNDSLERLKEYDFVFNLAESVVGSDIEEYDIAKKMEDMNVPFTGSGPMALKICMDKYATKKKLIELGLSTPMFELVPLGSAPAKKMNYPLIVKPVREDGSIGITEDSVVYDALKLKAKVKEVHSLYRQAALVEEYIDGREFNVAIIGNDETAEVMPVSEIVFDYPEGMPKIVSFDAKWLEDSMVYKNSNGKCPADIDEDTEKKLSENARVAYKKTGCRDYGRVDFRLREGIPYILEVNPNPCINPNGAGLVRSANTRGMSYDVLINKILEVAENRYQSRSRR
ncbi:MAG: ATP-grasp domain-containing protein [Nanoarchaeota archaeon]|nr:ATP-grasp domain-containing protein [Nanoarchaeota archaeon]